MRCKARTKSGKQCTFSSTENGLCGVHNKMKTLGKNVEIFEDKKKKVDDDEFIIETPEIIYPKNDTEFNDFEISENDLTFALNGGLTIYNYPQGDNLECQCCFCEYPKEECIWCDKWSCSFNHIYCKTCLNTYFEINTREGKSTLACPSDSSEACNGSLSIINIKKLISNEIFIKLEDTIEHTTVINLSKTLDNYYICPFCQRYGCIVDNDSINNIKCEKCEREWCKKCKQDSHESAECGRITGKFDKDLISNIVEECITNALLHKCPVCPSTYTKTEGCNLMTCGKCGTYSCYLCGIKITPKNGRKYWHFKGSGSAEASAVCNLYNGNNESKYDEKGNTEYNNNRIKNSCLKLYNVNDDDNVKKEILKNLEKHNVDIGIPSKKNRFSAFFSWLFCR